jgi:predicted MFS family arabinose efflux permease
MADSDAGDQGEVTREQKRFKLLLKGSSVSVFGSRLTTVAYPLLVLAITRSPVIAGWTSFAAIAPGFIAYLPVGVLVDRSGNPRRVMLVSECLRGAAIAGIVVTLWLAPRGILLPAVVVVVGIEQTFRIVSELAERSFVSTFLKKGQEASGLARTETWNQVAVMVGRPLGGLLYGYASILPFMADAVSFTFSVFILLCVRNKPRPRFENRVRMWLGRLRSSEKPFRVLTQGLLEIPYSPVSGSPRRITQGPLPQEILEAWRWLRNDAFVRVAIILTAGTTFIGQALIMVYLWQANSREFSALAIGLGLGLSGLGGAIGSLMAPRLFSKLGYSLMRIQMVAWALSFLGLAQFGSRSIPAMAAVMALNGFTGALGNVAIDTYLVREAGTSRLGRVVGIDRLTSLGACALGPLAGGVCAGLLGTQKSVVLLMAITFSFPVISLAAGRPRVDRSGSAEAEVIRLAGEPIGQPASHQYEGAQSTAS